MSFGTRTLVYTLILTLSGTLPSLAPLAHSTENAALLDASRLSHEGELLEKRILLEVRRVRFPKTPGTPAGILSDSGLETLEKNFRSWKSGLESLLALPGAPQKGSPNFVPPPTKMSMVESYVSRLASLATLRIFLERETSKTWRESLAIRLPKTALEDLPALGRSRSRIPGRESDPHSLMPIVLKQGPAGTELTLSESLIQGLSAAPLANDPTDQNHLKMVKYLATRQLLQNWAQLQKRKRSPRLSEIALPAEAQAALPFLISTAEVIEEQERQSQELLARLALIQTRQSRQTSLPALADPELVRKLLEITHGRTSTRGRAERAELEQWLLASLLKDAPEQVQDLELALLGSSNEAFSTLSDRDAALALRGLSGIASARQLLGRLMELRKEGSLALSPEQARQVLDLIERHHDRFTRERLPLTVYEDWARKARRHREEILPAAERQGWIETLILSAQEASERTQEAFAGHTVSIRALSWVLSPKLSEIEASSETQQIFSRIAQTQSYSEARDAYSQAVVSLTHAAVLNRGLVSAARVEKFLESKHFREGDLGLGEAKDGLDRELETEIRGEREKTIRQVLQVGDWFGFNRLYPHQSPRMDELLPKSGDQKTYYKRLTEFQAEQFRVLGIEINVPDSRGRARKIPLYEALAEITRQPHLSPAVMSQAEARIEQALVELEKVIRKDLLQVAKADRLDALQSVVTGSAMMRLVLMGYPEFTPQQERYVRHALSPRLGEQLLQRYAHPLYLAGMPVMLLPLIKWGAGKGLKRAVPFVEFLTEWSAPLIKGFEKAMYVLMAAESMYRSYELYEKYHQRDQVEDFYLASTGGDSFFTASEYKAADQGYTLAKWMFIGQLSFDTLTGYFPLIRAALKKRGHALTSSDFKKDLRAFRKLGVPEGNWGELPAAIERIRANAASVGPIELQAAEDAYARLSRKQELGQIWDLSAALGGQP